MRKYFNVAGPCRSEKHYMVPAGSRCSQLSSLVDQEAYFVIHAPRQVGKTTLIRDFVDQLDRQGAYLALYCTLETAHGLSNPKEGMPVILKALEKAIRFNGRFQKHLEPVDQETPNASLHSTLAAYCAALDKPLVIMFDEVDCLTGETLISFLRQLRQGYVEKDSIPFVHSLALVGVRNIRDYKGMVRQGKETLGSASPFNIVTEALTIRNFNFQELVQLYGQHTEATGQAFPEEVTQSIYRETSGQPWLCNAIARQIVEKILEGDISKTITPSLVKEAIEIIVKRRDTHIDSLLEKLKEPRVRNIVEPVLLGRQVDLSFAGDDAAYVFDLGLLAKNKGDVVPANRIYGEVIIRALTYDDQYRLPTSLEGRFIENGKIDMKALLTNFQMFWRENSQIWTEKYQYKEAAPHLILQAFLQRIINSGGHISREYSAGRGRTDLCITYGENRYAIELKIRYGPSDVEDGIDQLGRYLDTLGLKEGWLIIFDRRPNVAWDQKITWNECDKGGKTIHIIGC